MAPRKSTKPATKAAEEAVKTPAPMTEENQTVENEADVAVETKAETVEAEPKKEKKTPGRKPAAAKKETVKKETAGKARAEKSPAAKPGTYQLYLQAPEGALETVRGSVSILSASAS